MFCKAAESLKKQKKPNLTNTHIATRLYILFEHPAHSCHPCQGHTQPQVFVAFRASVLLRVLPQVTHVCSLWRCY